MKTSSKLFNTSTLLVVAGFAMAAGASAFAQTEVVEQVLVNYTDNTVVKTYQNMAEAAIALDKAVVELVASPTDAKVVAAADQWKKVRGIWEQSESFLFGPAAFTNLDPKLDSWPLDQAQLDTVLASAAAGKIEVEASYVRDYLGAALRGFHAVEYLLFRDGKPRLAKDFTPAELAYLAAATRVLTEDAIALEAWWAGMDSLTAAKKAYLEAAEIETIGSYAKEFKNAGKSGSRYASQAEAIEEIFQGCIDIADELAEAKLGGPAESGNPAECESWYSWTSLDDCRNNVISIQNAYIGTVPSAKALTDLVTAKNKAADEQVKVAIAGALKSIAAIKAPLRNSLSDKAAMNAAVASCKQLSEALENAQKVLAE